MTERTINPSEVRHAINLLAVDGIREETREKCLDLMADYVTQTEQQAGAVPLDGWKSVLTDEEKTALLMFETDSDYLYEEAQRAFAVERGWKAAIKRGEQT